MLTFETLLHIFDRFIFFNVVLMGCRQVFCRYQDEIVNYYPEDVEVVPWNFHTKMIFERFDDYVERLGLVEVRMENI